MTVFRKILLNHCVGKLNLPSQKLCHTLEHLKHFQMMLGSSNVLLDDLNHFNLDWMATQKGD